MNIDNSKKSSIKLQKSIIANINDYLTESKLTIKGENISD